MKLYASGGITDIPDFKDKFANVCTKLKRAGHEVYNPAEVDLGHGAKWEDYMRVLIPELCKCEGIYMMRGWHASRGATEELRIAQVLKLEIFFE